MQEENFEEKKDVQSMSVEDLFLNIQESYSEAQQRSLDENKLFQKTEFFRMDKFGVYRLRILPVAPNPDGTADRKSYEFPVRQMLLELEKPSTGSKATFMYVTVPRATDAGYSVDVIDTYRRVAVDAAKEMEDEKLAEKIAGGSFGGGLKFNYGHAMYVFDLDERAKGVQLLTLSHSQFKDLDERKFKLWQKKLAKNPHAACPISSVYNAYPVEIEKRKNGAKTEYITSIDNESDNDALSVEELNLLMAAPRIPEIIYRYSRYQFEATLEFLKQCDIKYGLQAFETKEVQEAVEQLRSELPKEDSSSFSFDKRTKESKENANNNGISLDDLFNRFDELKGQGLGDKTEEGQELRALIRTFIEQEKLSVRVTRSTTNQDLLDMIEEAFAGAPDSSAPDEPEERKDENPEETPTQRRRR
ncbi:MAG: hypothetical protein EZS26_001059 [Candidatus Ordinivivax streblomastigis]|uniref:Uncharacterized protein n=1 Tax=Candidatus Ordinivivax streblomastigis TaxID=2540710 RepID=A0A5M8P341_9BACT|nr:MAG: hypothetical protein EZS26_001059 [Candidatus Ordinivivax streblomastigis]